MTGIIFPNFAQSLLPLIEMDRQDERSRIANDRADLQYQRQLERDKVLMDRADREWAYKLDEAGRKRVLEAADWQTNAAASVLSAPPEQRQAALDAALADAEARGYGPMLKNFPRQYGPGVEGLLQFHAAKAKEYRDHLYNQPQAMPMPGAAPGAPGAAPGGLDLGRAQASIGGIESGGKYDALGPVVDGKGSRAYGRYQVMDFNIGPWTQEVLGRPMTPQEFLANPQAQDAVFNAKFAQFSQKYGGPEAAAKVWFGGPGGLSNPGAKDVLGTSVAGYADRFRQGYGGPQPAQMPNPPTALAQAGQGAVPMPSPSPQAVGAVPGNPAPMPGGSQIAQGDSLPGMPQAPAGPAIGSEVTDIRRQARAQGGDIFSIKGMPEIKEGHYVVRSLQDPRVVVGMVPIKQKETAAGQQGHFGGTSLDAQAMNTVMRADPSSPEYFMAYNHLSKPRTYLDEASGRMVTIQPMDLSRFARPTGGPGMAPAEGRAPGAPPPAAAPAPGTPVPAAPAPAAPTAAAGASVAPGVTVTQIADPKKSESFKKLEIDTRTVMQALDRYEQVIREAGGPDRIAAYFNNPQSPEAQKIRGAYNSLKVALRGESFFNTGVLQPGENFMIDNTLLSPDTFRGAMVSPEALKGALDEFRTYISGKVGAAYEVNGIPKPGKPQQTYMGPDNRPISWTEIETTAKNRGISTDEVVKRLNLKPAGAR